MKSDLIVAGEALPEFTALEDAAFDAWRDSMPAAYWAKYDLSACRLGWNAKGAADLRVTVGAHDVSNVIDLHQEPQRAAFQTYRVAFNANAADPNLKHAAALVRAWNAFAEIMGIDPA